MTLFYKRNMIKPVK